MKSFALAAATVLLLAACSQSAPRVDLNGASGSLATWPHHRSIDELVGDSELVVRAGVLSKVAERILTGHPSQRFPVALSEFRVQVERTLKGSGAGQIIVVIPGRDGDPVNTYPELPLLKPGTRVLLFLRRSVDGNSADGTARYAIVGPEGLYQVIGNALATTTDERLIRDAAGAGLTAFEAAVLRATQR